MSKSYNSPTARLLQHSRLFSLPKQLPQPQLDNFGPKGMIRASNTATLPYPTQQAIETPSSSQFRGDWGLKRQLPLRATTRSGTPTVRVLALDTTDHVTDFASAGSYERSLAKFQELAVPVLQRDHRTTGAKTVSKSSAKPSLSVYEEFVDITDPENTNGSRWKFGGDFIGGLQLGEVDRYLRRLAKRRPAWHEYLRRWNAEQRFYELKQTMKADQGCEGPFEVQQPAWKRDNVLRLAEKQVWALRDELASELAPLDEDDESRVNAEQDLADRCQRQMEEAELARQRYEAEAGNWSRWNQALDFFSRAEKRAAATVRYGEIEAANAKNTEDLSDAASTQSKSAEIQERAVRDAAKLMQTAFQEIIRILESDFDVGTKGSIEQHARALISSAQEARDRELGSSERLQKHWEQSTLRSLLPTREEVHAIEKRLRDDHMREKLSSQLTALLADFLDLPGMVSADHNKAASRARSEGFRAFLENSSFSGAVEEAPASTHPGAGLGYLRSNAHMANHPIHGPQAQPAPVLSRVLRARTSVMGTDHNAKLGVGGFVTKDSMGTSWNDIRRNKTLADDDPDRMALALDPLARGGNKLWVSPEYASVDDSGKLILAVYRSDKEAIAVRTGEVAPILAAKKAVLAAHTAPAGLPGGGFGVGSQNRPAPGSGVAPPSSRQTGQGRGSLDATRPIKHEAAAIQRLRELSKRL